MKRAVCFLILIHAGACVDRPEKKPGMKAKMVDDAIPAGTLLAADSMRIAYPWDNYYFSVKIVSNQYSNNGTYGVIAKYGPNEGKTMFTLPGPYRMLKPVLKKGSKPYTYLAGFYLGKDTTFHDCFLMSGTKAQIEMKYTKAYYFE